MATTARLWKLEDLRDYLGYDTTDSALAAVKSNGIPHVVLGGGAISDRGAARRARFVPSQVEAWAVAAQVRVEAPAPAEPGPDGAAAGQGGPRPAARPRLERAKMVGPRARR